MSLQSFFNPKSIAVVGASREKGKVGYEVLHSIVSGGYEGQVYPVNPHAEEIFDLKCYPDLPSIGQAPELVVIVVRAKAVLPVVEQCGQIGTQSVIVISSGFKEVGEEGRKLEEQLLQIARRYDIRLIGPNCLG